MPPILGNLIVLLVLAGVVALAIRSLWKSHKSGGHCAGCSGCSGCCPSTGEETCHCHEGSH